MPFADPKTEMKNRQIVLQKRPEGLPKLSDFAFVESDVPQLSDGQILVKHRYLGLAPAARIRMSAGPSYAPPTPIGGVIYGQAAGLVVASKHPRFSAGEAVVVTDGGWQEYSIASSRMVAKASPQLAPLTVWLGILGVSGFTAYVGLLDVGQPKEGEVVVVSAASGAVGSLVGQIARIKGCYVVGISGGPEKCAYVVDDLKFDACVDHRNPDFGDALARACPDGIDIYFDNVGGPVRDEAFKLMKDFGRVVICGLIAEYNDEASSGPSWASLLTKRLTVRGFLTRDYVHRKQDFETDTSHWYANGQVRLRDDISHGLEQTPSAFINLLTGKNFGKAIVELDQST